MEFVTLGVILLVPLVYLVLALGSVQNAALGTEAAARQVARVISTAPEAATASARADAVLRAVVADYGMADSAVTVHLRCVPSGSACPRPGAVVIVTTESRVTLPLVPPILGLDRVAAIPVGAQAAQKMSRVWGAP